MDLKFALDNIVKPASMLLTEHLANSPEARVMLLATGYQETKFLTRVQYGDGPAHGFWQFEQGGGVKGVCQHHLTTTQAQLICRARDCSFDPRAVWAQLAHDDILAAAFARLLLFTDSAPLPALGDAEGAWACYLRCWRPGKPRPGDWAEGYQKALALVAP